jgi:CTP:molybdopterin cytidylyltransferase MocA
MGSCAGPIGGSPSVVTGLVLAAGAGSRTGTPKALLRDLDGTPWIARGVRTLLAGGCTEVVVVLGASAERVGSLVPEVARIVVAEDWAEGLGASLRAGLAALDDAEDEFVDGRGRTASVLPVAALLTQVDLLGITPSIVRRMLSGAERSRLARASYQGRAGHPMLLGRDQWSGLRATARGASGARGYLGQHEVHLVECADLAEEENAGPTIDLRSGTTARVRRQ